MRTLIQIGCNTGNDIVSELVRKEKLDYILLIDANPYCIEQAKLHYAEVDNVHFEVAAVSNTQKNVIFYIPHFDTRTTSAHSSLNKNHVLKHGHEETKIKEFTMRSKTFTEIMEEHELLSVSKLFIDCEGEDVNIIKSLNFNKFLIEYIMYEHRHASQNEQEEAQKWLMDNGYTLKVTEGDTIAVLNI